MNKDQVNNLPATTNEAVVATKRQKWADLGEKIHNLQLELVSDANKIKSELVMPSDTSQINSTEAALKIVKQKTNGLVDKRKTVTNIVNVVFGKLMEPEKDLIDTYIPGVEKKLIELKKEKKTADDLEQLKKDELIRLKTESIKYINDYDLLFKQEINKKVSGALQYALGEGNITMELLPEYISKRVLTVFKPVQFVTPMYKAKLTNVTTEEFAAIWEEVKESIKQPVYYVGADNSWFEIEVGKTFEFYEAALLNKDAAAEQSKNIAAKNEEDLKKQNASSNVAATMQGMATSTAAVVGDKTKALKQKFELDMESTEQNALLIISAFVANLDMARQYVKADWFKLTVAQMGAALVGIKNNDGRFESTGIKFKVVDKL